MQPSHQAPHDNGDVGGVDRSSHEEMDVLMSDPTQPPQLLQELGDTNLGEAVVEVHQHIAVPLAPVSMVVVCWRS